MINVEVCCESLESCLAAQQGGAYRVELCSSLIEGGVTPSYGVIDSVREQLFIKLNVMIRPRGGDFVYSEQELEIMKNDILMAKSVGVDGVVFGCLTEQGDVDMESMKFLMEASKGLDVTFHRAIDVCRDPLSALEDIINLGCNRILTSGASSKASDGVALIKELRLKANNRLSIMPGCGVNISNVEEIISYTSVSEVHFSASVCRLSSSLFFNKDIDFGPMPKISSEKLVKQMVDRLNSLHSIVI